MIVSTQDGAALHCEVQGAGEPILLISGLNGSASFWSGQIAALADSRTVVTYDHRGAGRSTPSRIRYSVEQMSDDAIAVLDALNIDRAHVVGHSTGGCIGQVLAIEHPERVLSLVASSTWARADDYFRRLFELRRRILRDSGAEAYVGFGSLLQYPPEWLTNHHGAVEAAERAAIKAFPPAEIVESKIEALLSFDRASALHRIGVPTLVSAALDDLICPAHLSRALARGIPGSRLRLMPHGGHFYPRTRPTEFLGTLIPFLDSVENPPLACGSLPPLSGGQGRTRS